MVVLRSGRRTGMDHEFIATSIPPREGFSCFSIMTVSLRRYVECILDSVCAQETRYAGYVAGAVGYSGDGETLVEAVEDTVVKFGWSIYHMLRRGFPPIDEEQCYYDRKFYQRHGHLPQEQDMMDLHRSFYTIEAPIVYRVFADIEEGILQKVGYTCGDDVWRVYTVPPFAYTD